MAQVPDTERNQADEAPQASYWRSSSGRWTIAAFGIAAILLGWEYRAAILSSTLIIWLPLVLCVGMHFFMHRGHGSRHSRHDDYDR